MKAGSWLALLVLAAAPGVAVGVAPGLAAGQELGRRVAEIDDGAVRFSFDVREGVEICSRGVRVHEDRMRWSGRGRWGDEDVCRDGPARVELRVENGMVRSVELLRLGEEGTRDARSLGLVAPGEAVRYLVGLARTGAHRRAAKDAIFPAILADVPEIWPDLLALAKEREVPSAVRASALFWLGQEAAEAATGGLADVAFAEDEDQEVRDAAVFALSQRPTDEGLPVLMELARTADQAKTRRTAFFWLAQSDDPRVISFFEEVLLGRRGG